MIKAVIFDYGKVISDSPGTHIRKDIAEAYGSSEDNVGKAIGKFIGEFRKGKMTEDTFWEYMSEELGKKTPSNKYDLWRNDFKSKLVIFDDMLEFVKELKKGGLKVAVLSNNIKPFVDVIRERNGFAEFDLVINSCEVGLSKPDKNIYEYTLKKLRLSPNEVLFIDDREDNIETASTLGMRTLLANRDRKKLIDSVRAELRNG